MNARLQPSYLFTCVWLVRALVLFRFFNEQQSAGSGVNVTQANKADWIKADVCLQLKLFS